MSALSIRLNEEEKRIIDTYAKFNNKTITQVVKEAILEKIENEFDLNELNKAIEEYEKNSVSYSNDEVWKMLGI
ncbi:DUF6290 family protein [Fusobacterium simiae]|uniref:DUF6290 family protein n=1 Tax=Fusobacterium simiae TaxID=855 RepID=A0ABT4DGG4_FUSSI|nr:MULTISPECIES: DUF6290 family protein [Fusobacterium]MCY7007682.1 DUF6290 family protein [Fusobacterium simiae]MDC7954827.1 DUF6290 family protein [Fusobacterium simiae]